MAKYEKTFEGDFNHFLDKLHESITQTSTSASFEDGSDFMAGQTQVAVRVYERYSMAGANRVSLNLTIAGTGSEIFFSAITSGGSQAVFFKINTYGEETFLASCVRFVENYIENQTS